MNPTRIASKKSILPVEVQRWITPAAWLRNGIVNNARNTTQGTLKQELFIASVLPLGIKRNIYWKLKVRQLISKLFFGRLNCNSREYSVSLLIQVMDKCFIVIKAISKCEHRKERINAAANTAVKIFNSVIDLLALRMSETFTVFLFMEKPLYAIIWGTTCSKVHII